MENELTIKVSDESVLSQIRMAAEAIVSKSSDPNYYNENVAALLKFAGEEVRLPDGSLLSKTEIEDLNRNSNITGTRAKDILKLIFDRSGFYKNFSIIYGDELTIPMDIYTDIPEQLMSTKRAGRQLDKDEMLDLINITGQELFCRHVERQYDIPTELLRNFLYRPDFEKTIDDIIANSVANDFLRLATNGYTDTYTLSPPVSAGTISSGLIRTAFYTLHMGHEHILKTSNGTWVNSNGDTIFTGRLGTHLTPNKLNIDLLREIEIFNDPSSSAGASLYAGTNITSVVFSTDEYRVTAAATSVNYAKYLSMIEVNPLTRYKFSVKIKAESTAIGRFGIEGHNGELLLLTPLHVGTSYSTYTGTFYSSDNTLINIRLYSNYTSVYVAYKDILIERDDQSFTGEDIMQTMAAVLRTHRDDYKERDNVFVMSIRDYEKYSEARANPVAFVNGRVVGVNNTMREEWMTSGIAPNFRGKTIKVNPYKTPIDEQAIGYATTNDYGNIYYGPLKELVIGAQKKIEVNKLYNPRSRHGGSAIETTNHYYIDYGVRNKEAFSIAWRKGTVANLKCETPIVSNSNTSKGEQVLTGGAAATVVAYVYSDTPGAILFYALAANTAWLNTYEDALANEGVVGDIATKTVRIGPDTKLTLAAAAAQTYHFRAFKDGVLSPSTKLVWAVI